MEFVSFVLDDAQSVWGQQYRELSEGEAQQNRAAANEFSVKLELQADCLAGVWAHSTAQRQLLEAGDLESGLGAASAVGDDRIQKEAMRRVHPESFTHGTSAQRVQWFSRGYERGDVGACETFN